jgi:peptidoglycan hydrolase-like protein with peptidoglycan-binding domain
MPIKYGCKNKTIKNVQACLGVNPDGIFGPKTKNALISKGQNGDEINSGTIIAVCKQTQPTTQTTTQPTTQTTTQPTTQATTQPEEVSGEETTINPSNSDF